MQLLTEYLHLQKQIFEFFGYQENWRVIPLDDCREYFWRLTGDGPGSVQYADTEEELQSESGNYYEDSIYTQRFLEKYVYRGDGFTMVCCDPAVDGNKFLRVFDNMKERKIAEVD